MMGAKGFSPEELALLAAFDAEIDDEEDELTPEELQAARDRDAAIRHERQDNSYRRKLESVREYGRKHRKKRKQQAAKRYQANREACITKSQAYRAANLEKCKAAQRAWYQRNKVKLNAKSKAYYAAHKDQYREYNARHYEANREEILAKRRAKRAKLKEAETANASE